jgi:hypothetical protein
MSRLDIALAHAGRGRRVFPFRLEKRGGKLTKTPLVKWKERATADESRIRAWAAKFPRAHWGWVLDEGLIVADVDDAEAFAATRYELPEAPSQTTPSGGEHRLYRYDGTARQTVAEIPGLDTRVGGKGWVGLYSADAFDGDPVSAPVWLLMERPADEDDWKPPTPEEPISTRNEILEFVGRCAGIDEAILLGQLMAMHADGRIVDGDSMRPWTKDDFAPIAREFSRKPQPVWLLEVAYSRSVVIPPPPVVGRDEESLQHLLAADIPPLQWVIDGLIPDGLGIVAAAPKVGKSLFALQVAIACRTGERVLGHPTIRRPVLLYSLEDGRRITQDRARRLVGHHHLDDGVFQIRYTAPRLGSGLEEEVEEWLTRNPGGLVWIDMLARVRPKAHGKSGRTAYDEDYAALGHLGAVVRGLEGGVLVNTHDRKAGSEDWTARITGSRGVLGAADFGLFFEVPRGGNTGRLHGIGREIQDFAVWVERDYPRWVVDPLGGMTAHRADVYSYLQVNGPAGPTALAKAFGVTKQAISEDLQALVKSEAVVNEGGKYRASASASVTNDPDALTARTTLTDPDGDERGDPDKFRVRQGRQGRIGADRGAA